MKVLVTGANGFLGGHIVEKSLEKGHQTFAAVRPGADTSLLENLKGCIVTHFNYNAPEEVASKLSSLGPFDLIIHNAGLTKSLLLEKYIKVNVDLTSQVVGLMKSTQCLRTGGRFAYVSSMAARGPVGNNGPASFYGESKRKAEELVKQSGLNYLIFRPTGIYGARDIQFLPLIKAVRLGLYPLMTSPTHKMTLINARDVAENVIEASFRYTNEIIHLDDGQVYEHKDLKSTLEKLLHKKSISLRLPRALVLAVLSISDFIDKALKRTPAVSVEQYKEISQDWNFDFSEERKRIPLVVNYSLFDGFQDALEYYRTNKLI